MEKKKSLQLLSLFQGIYFFLTGLWPVLDISSFMAVTGPKTDIWLVRTVGVLIVAISFNLIASFITKKVNVPTFTLAIMSASALAIVDIIYVFNKTISPIYLLDGFVEVIIILCWIIFWIKN